MTARVTSNAHDYAYNNPIPGAIGTSVAGTVPDSVVVTGTLASHPLHAAVDSATEAGMFDVNPALSGELYLTSQQQEGQINPEAPEPYGAADLVNPIVGQLSREGEPAPTDHSPQAPLAPTSVASVPGVATHATVTWVAPADADGFAILGYIVTAHTSDGGTIPAPTTLGNVLTANISGLTSTKHYTFTVAAFNAEGTGASSAASASTLIA